MHALLLVVALTTTAAARPPEHIHVDEDEVVEGTGANPAGELTFARKQAKFGKLLKLRQDFRPELERSGDAL